MARFLAFSERYSSILADPEFRAELSPELYAKLFDCMLEFNERQTKQVSRYDSLTVTSSAYEEAGLALFEKHGWPTEKTSDVRADWLFQRDYSVTFDLIELWFRELSPGEQPDFQTSINDVFDDYAQPWRLVGGSIIRIDSAQFEIDTQRKYAELLNSISSIEPPFLSAANEFICALESYNRSDYKTCILDAEKSYESILKIVCNTTSGTANNLLNNYLESNYTTDLPISMNPNGFKSNVLMSLPFIRNNANVGHGDGMVGVDISKELAQLSLNLCSSLCTYMIELYKKMNSISHTDDDVNHSDVLPF